MPQFAYVAKDANGKSVNNVAEALNEQALVERLQREGYFVMSVEPAAAVTKTRTVSSQKRFSHNNVTLQDMLIFSRQLATMLEAGVTLLRSLDVILSQIESKEFHRVLTQIKGDVEQGKSLSSSLEKYPKVFSQFWVSLVEVGEASGTMPKVLEKLASYMEQSAAFQSTIVSALVYPIILFFVCIGAVSFFAFFVGPKFETIFNSMHVKLPGITIALLATFNFIKKKFYIVALGIFGVVVLFKQYVKTHQGRMQMEMVMFNMPVFGPVYKLIIVERFASQMAILIDSGVPILYALQITEKLVENKTCSLVISEIREAVREGKLLADPMFNSGFFPAMAVQMIKVGEETGELGKMLNHVANFYQRNVEDFMHRLGTMIEPFMLVFMGGIIGTIVLAMFLPMFNLSQLGGAGGG